MISLSFLQIKNGSGRARVLVLSIQNSGYHKLIGLDKSDALEQALKSAGANIASLRYAVRTDDNIANLAMIRAGLGIGVCQVGIAQKDKCLKSVLPELRLKLDIWIVMHEDLRKAPRVRAVFDHLVPLLQSYAKAQ